MKRNFQSSPAEEVAKKVKSGKMVLVGAPDAGDKQQKAQHKV